MKTVTNFYSPAGHNFIAKPETIEKYEARLKVVDEFSSYSGVRSFLTLPGTGWTTENLLNAKRGEENTRIYAIELDTDIFYEEYDSKPDNVLYIHGDVYKEGHKVCPVDGMWIDMPGGLLKTQIQILSKWWMNRLIRYSLFVTFTPRGINAETKQDRARFLKSLPEWIKNYFPGALVGMHTYGNPRGGNAYMCQFEITRDLSIGTPINIGF